MKLNAPKKTTCIIAIVLVIVAVIANFVTIPVISGLAFWLAVASAALMIIACYCKGL